MDIEYLSEYLKYYDDCQLKEIVKICQEEIDIRRKEKISRICKQLEV